MANRTVEALWRWSGEGELPIVIDASSCALGLASEVADNLTDENLRAPRQARHPRLRRLGEAPAPQASDPGEARVGRRSPDLLDPAPGAGRELREIAGEMAGEVVQPIRATCCGMAGDRGLLHPELTASATAEEAAELRGAGHDAYLCSNRTCEIGLQQGTGAAYESFVIPLERIRAVHRLVRGRGGGGPRRRCGGPLLRKRLRIPPAVTAAALAAGPPSLAVVGRRTRLTRRRDVRPPDVDVHDGPRAALRRSRCSPAPAAGRLPDPARTPCSVAASCRTSASSVPSKGSAGETTVDRFLSWAHWAWFLRAARLPDLDPGPASRALRALGAQMSAVYDIGCALYMAVPTAPPWWASEQGYTDAKVRRIMQEVGEEEWGRAWPVLYDTLGGNPWAAMPSLHFATSLMAALLLSETGPAAGAFGWTYAGVLGFALVYLGEHYVVDLLAGAAIVVSRSAAASATWTRSHRRSAGVAAARSAWQIEI